MYVAVLGPTGAGKSSLCKSLRRWRKWEWVPELLDQTVEPMFEDPLRTQLWFLRQFVLRERLFRECLSSTDERRILSESAVIDCVLYCSVLLTARDFSLLLETISHMHWTLPDIQVVLYAEPSVLIFRAQTTIPSLEPTPHTMTVFKQVAALYREYCEIHSNEESVLGIDTSGLEPEEVYQRATAFIAAAEAKRHTTRLRLRPSIDTYLRFAWTWQNKR